MTRSPGLRRSHRSHRSLSSAHTNRVLLDCMPLQESGSMLKISIFSSEKDNSPQVHDVAWHELCHEPIQSEKKNVLCWSPAVFRGQRALKNVESLSCLVFDLDEELDEELSHALAPYEYVVHSTFTPGRWRIIIKTSRSHTPDEHKALWLSVARSLGGAFDAACSDASRLYYWYTHAPGSEGSKFENFEPSGKALDVDAFLGSEPSCESIDLDNYRKQCRASHIAPARKPLVLGMLDGTWAPVAGSRNNSLRDAIGGLFTFATPMPNQELCEYLIDGVLSKMDCMPEGTPYWRAIALRLCERNREHQREVMASASATNRAFEASAQARGEAPDWRKQFQGKRDDNGDIVPKASGPNVALILRNDSRLSDLRYNTVRREIEALQGPLAGRDANTIDTVFANWLSTEYKITVPRADALAQLSLALSERQYDPLQEWLNSIKWDGTARIQSCLRERCGALGSDFYVQQVSKRWFIGAARRGLAPGVQMDNILVLKGVGGIGKTSFVRVLGGEFAAQTMLDLSNKDALHIVSGSWLVELAELSSWRKNEQKHFRGFLTQTQDVFRPPYGRVPMKHPRRACFVGTSNEEQPLDDIDGERRYWCLEVGQIDLKWLAENREQLWAEAVHYAKTETIHYFTAEEQLAITPEVRLHQQTEPLAERLESWFLALAKARRPAEVTAGGMLESFGFSPADCVSRGFQGSMGRALKSLGFLKQRKSTGERTCYYLTPSKLLEGSVAAKGSGFYVVPTESESPLE